MMIQSGARLQELCARLRERGSFALDTEFVQERTFFPRLGIVQVGTEEEQAIVDPGAVGNLDPLVDLLADPSIEKVVHSGRGDFQILYDRSGQVPRHVFDTQVAAALVGRGDAPSYARLVEDLLGIKLPKSATRTDWTKRPLSAEQIEYALDDVRHLPALRDRLTEELTARGRLTWLAEQVRFLEDSATYERPSAEEAYQRVKGAGRLNGRGRAILKELAAWREEEAERRDLPRGWVVKDEALVDIARRRPARPGALKGMRFLDHRVAERSGADIVAAVKRGLEAPPLEAEEEPFDDPRLRQRVALLDAWVQTRADEAGISTRVVATRDDLKALARADAAARAELPLLQGWRAELVGTQLCGILDGRLALVVDPDSGSLRLKA